MRARLASAAVAAAAGAAQRKQPFQYRVALMRRPPRSFVAGSLRVAEPAQPIDLARAHEQHERYAGTLRALGVEVRVLDADETLPDCCFVEDTAVCVGRAALSCRMGAPSRRGEAAAVRAELELRGVRVHAMPQTPLATASIDGGDVMYTGAELIVGLSARTNREGAEALARALAPLAVTTVPVAAGLHLKSVMSVCGPRHIAFAAESEAARAAVAAIRERGVGRYEFVSVPDEAAANCLFINGAVVHRAEAEYPRSAAALRAFCAAERLASRELDVSEFAKADGALTCLSVLLA